MQLQRLPFLAGVLLRVPPSTGIAIQQQLARRNLSLLWPLAQNQRPASGVNRDSRESRDSKDSKGGERQKPRTQVQKITLVQNQGMSVTTLEEAQKLAKRRELHLLRLEQADAKTGRPMFRLVTAAEMLADDSTSTGKASKEKGQERKSEKSLTIGARITEHDLASRLKNIVKWLGKRHEVRILIQGGSSGSDESSAERIVKAIEQTIREPQTIGKIVQRRGKGSLIKFSILPTTAAAPEAPTAAAMASPHPSASSLGSARHYSDMTNGPDPKGRARSVAAASFIFLLFMKYAFWHTFFLRWKQEKVE